MKEHLTSVNLVDILAIEDLSPSQWGSRIHIYKNEFPDLSKFDIAIIGVPEDRGAAGNAGCRLAPNKIRQQLYLLNDWEDKLRIVDLGNIITGLSTEDTYHHLSEVVEVLLEKKVLSVILGGSNDLLYAQYLGYKRYKEGVNIATVDARIDFEADRKPGDNRIQSTNYLSAILANKVCKIHHYSHIGYQTYLTNPKITDIIEQNAFEAYRLGNVRDNISEVEPIIRDADLLGVDISAVRQSDAPGNRSASPNGFFGEEACQIIRYAGLNNRLTSIGFFEYNPDYDKNFQTAQLIAQMIWSFVNGFYNRKEGDPFYNKDSFVKYLVNIKDLELVFWKHKTNERWWLEIPDREGKHRFIACSYVDYQVACNEELPDRWILSQQKSN